MTEKDLTKKEMFLAYAIYVSIIAFITIFFKEILDFLKLIPIVLRFVWDFIVLLSPYLIIAFLFLAIFSLVGLKKGFNVVLICSLIIIPIIISFYYINELKPDRVKIFINCVFILFVSYYIAYEFYQNKKGE
ncbi:TPA: hypothetical protein RTG68_001621 [Campylobacter jejuni]|nr:hypothetical protein [Campylobacter jejuni]HDZ5011411.1 hypothetical protein [Campylobacter jejuni]HDZ5014896.1 hypothetical protein [Campylobacter jejuni]HDZ5039457.1 hypothetical protein [Campylobacter jejuni]HDZ5051146.1 hypothetical protein [Campylobacter jejuni]